MSEHEENDPGTGATGGTDGTDAADGEGERTGSGSGDGDGDGDGNENGTGSGDTALRSSVVDEAERLTRLAREAVDGNEAAAHRERRDELLAEYGYVARVRSDGADDTLVLHPAAWLDDDGRVRLDRVDDVDRGVERPLSGTGDADDWDAVEEHNRTVAERVEREHGPVHGANAHAFADFMGNHYAKPVERATPDERAEFLSEYFPRNAWPTDEQRAAVERSLSLVADAAERDQ